MDRDPRQPLTLAQLNQEADRLGMTNAEAGRYAEEELDAQEAAGWQAEREAVEAEAEDITLP